MKLFSKLGLLSAVISVLAWSGVSFVANAEQFQNEDAAVKKCEAGDVASCSFLAQNYLNLHDYPKTEYFLTKVCYSQSPDAEKSCSALTTILTDPTYKLNNYKKGVTVAEYLCDNNSSYGCMMLSTLYFVGEHVPQSLEKAKDYGNKACQLRDATGCRQVALVTFSEAYVLHDLKRADQAFSFYKKACDLGDKDSCEEFSKYKSKMEQFTRYVESNRDKAPQQ